MQKTQWKTWLVYALWILVVVILMALVWSYFAKRISQIDNSNF